MEELNTIIPVKAPNHLYDAVLNRIKREKEKVSTALAAMVIVPVVAIVGLSLLLVLRAEVKSADHAWDYFGMDHVSLYEYE